MAVVCMCNTASAGFWDDLIGGVGEALCSKPNLTCEEEKECLKKMGITSPYFYCECKNNTTPFSYGMDIIVSDTTWFTAKLTDIKKGLTAYWFSDASVHFDIYPTCTSSETLLSVTIGKNSAYNMSSDVINEKIESLGGLGDVAENMNVNIRVAPKKGHTGRAIFTSYDEGHHSTCDYPMPVVYKLPYVLSEPDNHYLLSYTTKPKNMAVRWVQNKKESVRVELTKGNCATTDVIASAVLTDSTKVWIPDFALLEEAYTNKDSLYFHFYTEAVGRVFFVAPYTALENNTDTTLCQGFGLHLADTSFYASTVYRDTFLMGMSDTILFTTYNLTVTAPVAEYDTMIVKEEEFPFLYLDQAIVNRYGDIPVTLSSPGECDRQIYLHVKSPVQEPTSLINGDVQLNIKPTMAKVGEDIRINGPIGANVQVYTLLGEQVMNMTLQQEETTFSIPVKGHYIVKVNSDKGQLRTRIFIK